MTTLPGPEDLDRSTERWMRWGIGVMVTLTVAFPLYRIAEPGSRSSRADAAAHHLVEQGADIYQAECADCHGLAGSRGEKAPTLNSAQFLLTTADDRIRSLVSVGIPGSDMSAYSIDYGGSLSTEQIRAVTAYLRSLEDDAPDVPDWRTWAAPE